MGLLPRSLKIKGLKTHSVEINTLDILKNLFLRNTPILFNQTGYDLITSCDQGHYSSFTSKISTQGSYATFTFLSVTVSEVVHSNIKIASIQNNTVNIIVIQAHTSTIPVSFTEGKKST